MRDILAIQRFLFVIHLTKRSMILEICGHIGYEVIYYPIAIYITLQYMKEIQCKVYKKNLIYITKLFRSLI